MTEDLFDVVYDDEDEGIFLDDPDEGLPEAEPTAGPPLVPARPCPDDQLPAAARTLVASARSSGWAVQASHWVAWNGTIGTLVRLCRSGVLLAACWDTPVGGRPAAGQCWRHPGNLGIPDSLTITELKGLV